METDSELLASKSCRSGPNICRKTFGKWFKGCRGGATIVLLYGILVLILNIALATWLSKKVHSFGGLVVLSRRSCQSSKAVVQAVHLLINILASLLLAASNYCLQILISPLREEIDLAHESTNRNWMCVGIPNSRNLLQIRWMRRVLWLLLALSSLPVHLLWNSAIVQTLPANDYHMAIVTNDFASGAPVNLNATDALSKVIPQDDVQAFEQQWLKPLRADPINMTVGECILNYSQPFISDYSSLALVLNTSNSANSLLLATTFRLNGNLSLGSDWPCGVYWNSEPWGKDSISCDPAKLAKSSRSRWVPVPYDAYPGGNNYTTVKYCLAQQTTHKCEIGLPPTIIYISLVTNTLKVICFCGTLFHVGSTSKPLVTTGDIINSFISRPDPHLNSRCLASFPEVNNVYSNFWDAQKLPIKWLPKRRRWIYGIRLRTWLSHLAPAILGICTVIALYLRNHLYSSLSLGFASTSTSELVWWGVPWNLNHGLVRSVLLANSPQAILSYSYTAYNAVLTGMVSQSELLRYSSKRRGLRVTEPVGDQRSTYWLGLPYRYSLTLIAMSTMLHWLVAESFFLVRVNVYAPDGTLDPSQLVSTVGYSSLAIIVSLTIMVLMLLGILALGLAKSYPTTMPLAANCSALLAAITQPSQGRKFEADLAQKELSWGHVVSDPRSGTEHATFAAWDPIPLVEKSIYA